MRSALIWVSVIALSGALVARAENPPPPPEGEPPAPPPAEAAPAPAPSEGEAAPPASPEPAPAPAPPPGAPAPGAAQGNGEDRTPPRLSFTDGEVSFWRSGADDWTPAQINTPLAPNDQLYAGERANIEVQVAPRAFVRAGEDTQFGFSDIEPDFLQLRIVSGHASLDLRSIKTGMTVEVDTPQAAFTVEHPGYYRIDVSDENTTFTSRRGGRATVTPANGQSGAVASSEEVVLTGTDQPQLATYAAPELDAWDQWNYTRTDHLIDSVSSRYVPYGEYGTDDLDHNGDWRVVPQYGSVWVPTAVAPGWAPYTTGSWVYDPFYGWTWVDTAPWGWAPFHYGRWVFVGGFWGWAPGPLVVHPAYAPALVAFFNGPSFSIGVSFGHANVGWVALGWGEPCVPWWGGAGFRGSPHWVGWGGPHVVNNVVINKTTIVNVNEVHGWANAQHQGAVVGVGSGEFGHGMVHAQHFDQKQFAKFEPMHGNLTMKPTAASLAPTTKVSNERPPRSAFERRVVATREPRKTNNLGFDHTTPPVREDAGRAQARAQTQSQKLPVQNPRAPAQQQVHVVAPDRRKAAETLSNRPPFGRETGGERQSPPEPPRFGSNHAAQRESEVPHTAPPARPEAPARSNMQHARTQAPSPRELPGEPANRVFRGHGNAEPRPAPPAPHAEQHAAPQPHHGGGGEPHGRPQQQQH